MFLKALLLFLLTTNQTSCDSLSSLRQAVAKHYCSAEPHVRLSHYHFQHGRRLLAFAIAEEAWDRCGDALFLATYKRIFTNQIQCETRLTAAASATDNQTASEKKQRDLALRMRQCERLADWKTFADLAVERHKIVDSDLSLTNAVRALTIAGDAEAVAALKGAFAKRHPRCAAGYEARMSELLVTDVEAAEALATEALRAYPRDCRIWVVKGMIAQSRLDLGVAAQCYEKARTLAPNRIDTLVVLIRFSLRIKEDPEGALRHALTAYFADPLYYSAQEGEELSIRSMADACASRELASGPGEYKRLLASDNPWTVDLTLLRMDSNWNALYIKDVLGQLSHDDPALRWRATTLLMDHIHDVSKDAIHALAMSTDLRQQGLALYLAIKKDLEWAFPIVRRALHSQAELVRVEAIDALQLVGGSKGETIVREYRASGHEQQPVIIRMLKMLDNGPTDPKRYEE